MQTLLILNDAPYGSERTYNGVRLALAMLKVDPAAEITLFLLGDAVGAAKAGQTTPEGYYNLELMLGRVLHGKGSVMLCGACMNARGLQDAEMVAGVEKSTMDALAQRTLESDRVLIF